jgi:hypothetical protein
MCKVRRDWKTRLNLWILESDAPTNTNFLVYILFQFKNVLLELLMIYKLSVICLTSRRTRQCRFPT